MKSKFLTLLSLVYACTVSAQLVITPGAQFSITGKGQVTLQNTDLVNNGSFLPGNSAISFSGNATSSIRGSQPIQFNELEINKANNSSILLQRVIGVSQRVLFTSGFLDLNGFDTNLGTSGHLDGEQENTCIIGPNGGEVYFTTILNSPADSNPANLGIFITCGQNLGNVTIKRGHKSQVTNPGTSSGVLRYYDILSSNNMQLNATLRFKYLDRELRGLNENSIVFFKNRNTTNWTGLAFTSRDAVANFVEKTGIGSLGRFTLSGSAEDNLGGKVQYSTEPRSTRGATDELKLWPNPVHDMAFINIVTRNESQALIKVFNSKGALVKIQKENILRGSNQLSIDMKFLANGVYQVSVGWNNGEMQKTKLVVKQ